ncbi:MAG: ATP-binding protein [Verrucomicrobiae bacterium]
MTALEDSGLEKTTPINYITERMRVEERLREVNDELRCSTRLAEELAVKAEAANRAKSDFLAIMSHELRTPLHGMLGFAEILSGTGLNDEQMSYARKITECGQQLLSAISDILDLSSMEKGQVTIRIAPVAVAELVESACLTARQTAADKGLAFRCEMDHGVPEQIAGDARRICQILVNILGNAVKFTKSGSVRLRVMTSVSEAQTAMEFSVEDTGIGIPRETLGILFAPFTQGNSTLSRPYQGSGIGLAISKRLAEGMGGSITVASAPGVGSTFTFRLPL